MTKNGISQIPVTDGDNNFVGSLSDNKLLSILIQQPDLKSETVESIMDKPFIFVGLNNTVDALSGLIKEHKALLVRDELDKVHIITQADLLEALA